MYFIKGKVFAVKETAVNVISIDPPLMVWHVRFTTVTFKASSDQV